MRSPRIAPSKGSCHLATSATSGRPNEARVCPSELHRIHVHVFVSLFTSCASMSSSGSLYTPASTPPEPVPSQASNAYSWRGTRLSGRQKVLLDAWTILTKCPDRDCEGNPETCRFASAGTVKNDEWATWVMCELRSAHTAEPPSSVDPNPNPVTMLCPAPDEVDLYNLERLYRDAKSSPFGDVQTRSVKAEAVNTLRRYIYPDETGERELEDPSHGLWLNATVRDSEGFPDGRGRWVYLPRMNGSDSSFHSGEVVSEANWADSPSGSEAERARLELVTVTESAVLVTSRSYP